MTNKFPKVLLICDKWCDGKKEFGLSEWDKNLVTSLESSNIANVDVFHLDEVYLQTGKKGDDVLLKKIRDEKPDIVFLYTNKMPSTAMKTPTFSTLNEIKNVLKIPIIAIWADLEMGEQVQISLAMLPYVTLNIAHSLSAVLERINKPGKYLYMWNPKDAKFFNNPNKERDIDISYMGTPKKDRLKKVTYLKDHGINVVHNGGERQDHLTTEQYADRYQRSKISLSFSRAAASHVINTRPFEAFLCGAMLLEQESFELMKLYTPYIDYVPYLSKRDMLRKAKYFLTHDEERERIARNGQKKTEELYSAKRFWQIVIDKTLGNDSGEEYKFEYAIPEGSLSKLSPFTALKMKFLNALCRTNSGFVVYKMFNKLYWQDLTFFVISKFKPFLAKLLPKKTFNKILSLKRKLY